MSYILDALRRADAERERGNVPSIHGPATPRSAADAAAPTAANPLVWIIIGLSVVLLGALAWITMSGGSSDSSPAPLGASPGMPAPATVTAAAPAPATRSVDPTKPSPDAAPPLAAPLPIPPVVEPRSEAPKPAPAGTGNTAATANAPRSAKGTTPPAAENAKVMELAELPDDLRRELPALTVGGAMHSQTAANRMLIVNGQLLHEGDKITPGLTLEQIRLKSAVLAYKGYRFSISY